MHWNHYSIPDGDLKELCEAILQAASAKDGTISDGGCRAFYTPDEWADREELWGKDAELIVVHDGGDFAPCFNADYGNYPLMRKMAQALERLGYYSEPCTCWYTGIYKHKERPR